MRLTAIPIQLGINQQLQSIVNRQQFKIPTANGECPPVARVISPQGQLVVVEFFQLWQEGVVIKSRTASIQVGQTIDGQTINAEMLNNLTWAIGTVSEDPIPQQRINQMTALWIQAIDVEGYRLIFKDDETFGNQLYGFKPAVIAQVNQNNTVNRPTTPGGLLGHSTVPSSCAIVRPPISGGRFATLVEQLNDNPNMADKLDLDTMGQLIKDSEVVYFNATEDPDFMLEDRVYDYIKDLYRVRMFAERNVVVEGAAVSGDSDPYFPPVRHGNVPITGMEHVPEPVGRMVKLPVWMGSLSKVQHGDNKLSLWKANYPGPYVVAAKMDGASALRFWEAGKEKLYSRGKNGMAQDISELLPYLQLPILDQGVLIRGELILKKSDFANKYKRVNRTDKTGYRNARNAIGSGLVNKIGCRIPGSKSIEAELNIPFMADIKYVVYEAMSTPAATISQQYQYLEMRYGKNPDGTDKPHCSVAPHFTLPDVTDEILSQVHDKFEKEMDYDIDGVVVISDHQYDRPYGANPPYARAYKKPLASLMGVTTVTHIDWNLSKHGYLKPTVNFLPVELDGSTITKATGNNAGYIRDNNLGPGAVVEIVRSNSVIPMIITFVKPAPNGPQLPTQKAYWSKNNVDLILDQSDTSNLDPAAKRAITVKQMRFFLKTIGVKGIASAKLDAMYGIGVTTIPLLFAIRAEHLQFMGPVASQNIIDAIQAMVGKIPLPVLATASGAFGRGIGMELLTTVFNAYPGILESQAVQTNNIEQLIGGLVGLPDFGIERATAVANGFRNFLTFLGEMRRVGYPVVTVYQPPGAQKVIVANHPLQGVKIAMTGFHQDTGMNNFIPSVGGVLQKAMRADTQMLIIADEGSENNKTRAAQKKGVHIITREEFRKRYMS
jgi:NAD-dependent DNA ligase